MSTLPQDTALMAYLKDKGPMYHAKILELREVVENWLAYIPATFPHYTRHTVKHSDEIVLQISKLLFKDGERDQIILPLTAVEVYVVLAASYLHDAGMVASEREKIELLKTDEWASWISGAGGGAKRWNDIQNLRHGTEPPEHPIRNFLADLQTRFLLAEFIRRVHHLRATKVIDQHQAMLGRFAFDDFVLQRTIADICVSHGLRTYELEDQERFPDRRDIRGEPVNVRLMAVFLRLGDLLDMTADRACPLLLNAACPLPSNSLAHWTQYQRITHRLTAPDRIEITAECENQDEHRILQDWCQWIVDEVRAARTLLSRSLRHKAYDLPVAEIEGSDRTIDIRPAGSAKYFPSSWTFELDQEAVFQRLIYDVYQGSEIFVRELIQNALDANRCQMYADLISDSIDPPQFPTQVDEDRRSKYPVRISLKWIEVENPLSQESERQQVVTIQDCGIGMDKEIIQRYFLQVGRSFYTSEEFRRSFRFVPTSRFGLGFLSVFAVSDNVTVETYKPSSPHKDGAVRLTLTGPRNYLLTERGTWRREGTEIQVLLREPMKQGRVTSLVSEWCRRVEFPIIVDDLGKESTITSETLGQFVYDIPDVSEENARLITRAFPVNRAGIEGELYVFARVSKSREDWGKFRWAKYTYPELHPQAVTPEFPKDLTCLHGIALTDESSYTRGNSARIDYRGEGPPITLSRIARHHRNETDPDITSRWEEILTEHLAESPLATSENGWRYKQGLVDVFPLDSFWRLLKGMIPIYRYGHLELCSVGDVELLPGLTIVVSAKRLRHLNASIIPALPSLIELGSPTLIHAELLCRDHWEAIVGRRVPLRTWWLSNEYLAMDWLLESEDSELFGETFGEKNYSVELPDTEAIGCTIDWRGSGLGPFTGLLQVHHPFVQWLRRVRQACAEQKHGLKQEQFKTLMKVLGTPLKFSSSYQELQKYVDAWRNLPNLSTDLYPPEIEFTRQMFELKP